MSEMAQTADLLVVIGRGRLLAETSVAALTSAGTSLEDAYLRLTENAGLHQAGSS
jgi:ABC-2 type transport system ATP-binding protein